MRALKIAATGMAAQQMRVETISNNLANMSTTGYKRASRRVFRSALPADGPRRHGEFRRWDCAAYGRAARSRGAARGGQSVNLQQGSLGATNGDLDVAIEGNGGYLEVTLPSGLSAYTRDGGFETFGGRANRDLRWLPVDAGNHHPG